MSKVLNNLGKRRSFAAVIDGDTYYLTPLSHQLIRRMNAFDKIPLTGSEAEQAEQKERNATLKAAFIYGRCLCKDESHEPEFCQEVGETDVDFAARVHVALEHIDFPTKHKLSEAIAKSGTTPSPETVLKN